jgi:hypothetical protein
MVNIKRVMSTAKRTAATTKPEASPTQLREASQVAAKRTEESIKACETLKTNATEVAELAGEVKMMEDTLQYHSSYTARAKELRDKIEERKSKINNLESSSSKVAEASGVAKEGEMIEGTGLASGEVSEGLALSDKAVAIDTTASEGMRVTAAGKKIGLSSDQITGVPEPTKLGASGETDALLSSGSASSGLAVEGGGTALVESTVETAGATALTAGEVCTAVFTGIALVPLAIAGSMYAGNMIWKTEYPDIRGTKHYLRVVNHKVYYNDRRVDSDVIWLAMWHHGYKNIPQQIIDKYSLRMVSMSMYDTSHKIYVYKDQKEVGFYTDIGEHREVKLMHHYIRMAEEKDFGRIPFSVSARKDVVLALLVKITKDQGASSNKNAWMAYGTAGWAETTELCDRHLLGEDVLLYNNNQVGVRDVTTEFLTCFRNSDHPVVDAKDFVSQLGYDWSGDPSHKHAYGIVVFYVMSEHLTHSIKGSLMHSSAHADYPEYYGHTSEGELQPLHLTMKSNRIKRSQVYDIGSTAGILSGSMSSLYSKTAVNC